MEEGLDGDDAYVMVEDEFQTVAKSFTQYLHHAEYIRLKNRAKAQNASTINTISRPVDTITKMREETKKKKEAQTMAVKQKDALQHMKAQSGRPRTDDEESGSDSAEADDPWIGTSLQGLMTSPKKTQTSLTGLGGVTSKTRAAAGYAKAQKIPAQTAVPFDLAPPRASNGTKISSARACSDASTSEDDDDLDAPAASKPLSPDHTPTRMMARRLLAQVKFADVAPRRYEDQTSRGNSSDLSTNLSLVASSSSSSTSKYSWKTPQPMFGPFDEPPGRTDLAEDESQRMAKRRTELKIHKAKEERIAHKKTIRSDEIPVFLV